jgi:hypothetical protein
MAGAGLAARRGVIVLHEAFGGLTPDENSPPWVDAIYPVTKPITATAAFGQVLLNRGI